MAVYGIIVLYGELGFSKSYFKAHLKIHYCLKLCIYQNIQSLLRGDEDMPCMIGGNIILCFMKKLER